MTAKIMDGQKLPYLIESTDGRKWSIEVFGRGQKVRVTDIMSPTGYHEWIDPEKADIKWLPYWPFRRSDYR